MTVAMPELMVRESEGRVGAMALRNCPGDQPDEVIIKPRFMSPDTKIQPRPLPKEEEKAELEE